jgi:hypothetical protein
MGAQSVTLIASWRASYANDCTLCNILRDYFHQEPIFHESSGLRNP